MFAPKAANASGNKHWSDLGTNVNELAWTYKTHNFVRMDFFRKKIEEEMLYLKIKQKQIYYLNNGIQNGYTSLSN